AFQTGVSAVRAAIDGNTAKMVTLVRGESDQYSVETGLVDLSEVANHIKPFPINWINEDQVSLNYQSTKYASPFIMGEVQVPYENGTPKLVSFAGKPIARKLPHFEG